MNADEIREMPAGVDMDAEIAERVFGMPMPQVFGVGFTPTPYSTSIAAAWEVVEKINSRIGDETGYQVAAKFIYHLGTIMYLSSEEAACAICRAALLALLVQERNG